MTTTNSTVAKAATIRSALPRGTVLVGVFQRPAGNEALVRDGNGRVRSISAGDRIGRATVVAIGEAGVHLAQGGKVVLMTIPGG